MHSFNKYLMIFISLFSLITNAFSDILEDTLKDDFSKQETIKIRFEVNKRLYSFEAGKFKLENIKKNRDKIRAITERIVPWAIMEHLTSPEVARIIVYMYHADEAGATFMDAEDLIPLIAQNEIPLKDFILMVQYNKETKEAGIPEEIKDAFLGYTFLSGWDGISILAGGRGLILAKASGLNINKTASLLLKRLPAKGAKTNSAELISSITNIIGEISKERNSQQIIQNIENSHESVIKSENSPAGLKVIVNEASQIDKNIKIIKEESGPHKPDKNSLIDKESGIIYDLEAPSKVSGNDWQILNRNDFYESIRPWLGIPYRFGNKTGRPGIDCSGFTRKVLTDKRVGVPGDVIGHGTRSQSKAGKPVSRQRLRAGDLVFFSASPNKNKITHVGLVTSPGYFTHACSRGVINDDLSKKWWRQRYVESRRIFTKVVE